MLDLDFTPEQDMLRDMVRGCAPSTRPSTSSGQLEDDPVGIAADLWKQLAASSTCWACSSRPSTAARA